MDAGAPSEAVEVEAGRGELASAFVAGASAVVRVAARNPLKIVVVRERGPCARVHLATFGGGLVSGDHVRVGVVAEAESALFVGASAPGKVYRAESGATSALSISARVEAGALLILAPPPVACFAGARYRQRVDVTLAEGATLACVDSFTSGRAARGERWAFERLEAWLSVTTSAGLLVREAMRLEASATSIAERFGAVEAIATVVLVGPRAASVVGRILQQYQSLAAGRGEAIRVAASPIAGGVIVRAASNDVEALGAAIDGWLAPLVRFDEGSDTRGAWHGPW